MSEKLNEIEDQLKNYANSNRQINEELFNIGVELGRLLEKRGIDAHRLQFFEQQEARRIEEKNKYDLAKKSGKVILQLVQAAYILQYKEYGSIEFSDNRNHRSDSKLEDEIAERFCLQLANTNQNSVGGELELGFRILSQLAILFERYELPPFILIILENDSGEDSVTLYDEESIQRTLRARGDIFTNTRNLSTSSLEQFGMELEKFALFKLMKNS